MKKTGIELIAEERQEQLTLYPCFIEKHEYGVKVDAAINKLQQLPDAAITLLEEHPHELTAPRSEEHTSELQSRPHLVCRLLLEKKKDVEVESAKRDM